MNTNVQAWVLPILVGLSISAMLVFVFNLLKKSGMDIPAAINNLIHVMNSAEDLAINLISILVPWGVPLIPAYITYQHVQDPNGLNFGKPIALVAGAVVEALGLATMNTFFKFRKHNLRYKDGKNQMPTWVPVSAYIWYLLTTILVNVVFDWNSGVQWYYILAVGLFSTLSVPAGMLISVRASYTEWRVEHDSKSTKRAPSEVAEDEPEESEETANFAAFIEEFLSSRGWTATSIGTHQGAFMTQARLVQEIESQLQRVLTKDEKKNLSVKITRMKKAGK